MTPGQYLQGRPVEKFDINMALSLFNVNNYKTIRFEARRALP